MSTRRLHLSLRGTRVGQIELSRWNGHSFTPDDAWLERGQVPCLGAVFRARPGRLASTHLPLWFENLLPEKGSALRAALAAFHGLREGQSFDLLRVLWCDLPGAVRVEAQPAFGSTPADKALRFSLTGMQLQVSVVEQGAARLTPS